MATVLVIEPHPEVRELLIRIVRRLDHDVVVEDGRPASEWSGVDVVLVEPAAPGGLDVAGPLVRESGAALVCASIYPLSKEALELGPVAYLQKPFSLAELERAIVTALESLKPLSAA